MGQHTWFIKDKSLYLKQQELYEKLDSFDEGIIKLSEEEVSNLLKEVDDIDEKNEAPFHDLFRTGKRNADRSYIDEIICSREECFKWIEIPENFVSFGGNNVDDEQERKELAYKELNEFWDEYPNGLIYFC